MKTQILIKTVKKFSRLKALVIGDIMLDEYQYGKCNRLSPEAPVPIIEIEKIIHVPGGAANTAANLSSVGITTYIAGVIGKDHKSSTLLQVLKNKKIDTKSIVKDIDRPTTVKSRIVAQYQHIVRIDSESVKPINHGLEKTLIKKIKKIIPSVNFIIISDYAKGVITPLFSQQIINLGKKYKKPVYINPKGKDFTKYKDCHAIILNKKELEIALNLKANNLSSLPYLNKMMMAHVNSNYVLTTLSADGMALLNRNSQYYILPAADIKVVDVSGCGDTAVAVFSAADSIGASDKEAILLSTLASAVVIGKMGTATCSQQELLSAINEIKLKSTDN